MTVHYGTSPRGLFIFKALTIIPLLAFLKKKIQDGVISWLIPGVNSRSAGLEITPRFTPTRNRTTKCASSENTLNIVGVGSIGLFDAIFRSSGLIGVKSAQHEVLPYCRLHWNGDESFSSP